MRERRDPRSCCRLMVSFGGLRCKELRALHVLQHMAHIEQSRLPTNLVVGLGEGLVLVGKRHRVPAKRYQFRALIDVQGMQRRLLQRLCGRRGGRIFAGGEGGGCTEKGAESDGAGEEHGHGELRVWGVSGSSGEEMRRRWDGGRKSGSHSCRVARGGRMTFAGTGLG